MLKSVKLDNAEYSITYDDNQCPEKYLRYGEEEWRYLVETSNKCIVELYKLLDKIRTDAENHDTSLVRIKGGASGCDMYQGKPPISRILDSILDKYDEIIYCAFKSIEQEESTNG